MKIEKLYLEYDNCSGMGFKVSNELVEATGFDKDIVISEFELQNKFWSKMRDGEFLVKESKQ